jgi:tetratricopeptide (TPR) repeat protein
MHKVFASDAVTGSGPVDSQGPARGPVGLRGGRVVWPVRAGAVPPLADGFMARSETAPGLGTTLIPGTAVVLAPGRVAAEGLRDWLGSCGKTQIAVSFAEWLWQSRRVQLLLWVAATSRASVLSGYVEGAVAAMGADPAGDAESTAARFLSFLSETGRPWLVVFDDLADAADLEGLWPKGPAGMTLVTTADPATVPDERGALILPVGVFSSREALSYLMGRLTADPDQRLGAIDLTADLGCEPLALAQASVVIASSALSCREYRDYFVRRREQRAAAGAEPPAAAVTWTFSVEQADRLAPGGGVQSVLGLAALLDGHGIPGAIFASSAACEYLARDGARGRGDRERTWGALLTLERAGLLTIDRATTPPTVRINSVLQAAIRAAMPEGMLDRAVQAAADALLEVWPPDEQQAWLAAGLRSCAASVQRAAGDRLWRSGCHLLLKRAGQSLDSARLTGPAVAYWRELAAASDRVLGPGHPDTLMAGQRLADAYLAAGRAAEAVSWFEWVLADRVRVLGPDHPGTITARHDLGHAAVAASQFGEAVTILDGAASDYERVRGPDHPDTLGARDELAAAYRAAGQFGDAIRLYRRTLGDRERRQGPQHPDTMTTRQHLAEAYLADGRLKDAISHYKRTLADRERALGADHPDTLAARGNLGSAYHSAGRMASAVQLHEQTCADYERVLGADHPDTLARRASLANAYYAVGRLGDAATLLRDTVARCERVLPPGDSLTQTVRESLTNIAGGDPR